ncbi:Redoxin [Rubrobacter xylanophilus DSM 9941]|uniref:thioredoxin-dependent peroxiredoxin n=1 Tax=Rubrobacter xylanophilus (strain DSM 9941 / JCM 11954 / NBRC 16129 / PRD-1) TaxID=266117 RepID=Q1AV44_RUBXD|nr:peroxiredoxin [Rubrobacter xylanophilus]ABG04734.1 Redoxin [Rubrobacter xylanophilus DSM 9941]
MSKTPREGERFPELSFLTEEGRRVSTGDLLGQTTVLYFYPKDQTPGCTREACAFRDRMEDYGRAGIKVYGVSLDPPESHRRFRERNRLNFPLLTDEEGRAARELGILSEKGYARRVTFLLDAGGTVIRVYPEVSPETHADEVLAAASSAGPSAG